MASKINLDHTTYIRTFLQALRLYFHYDEWNGASVILSDSEESHHLLKRCFVPQHDRYSIILNFSFIDMLLIS
jgi:hypothetical protein